MAVVWLWRAALCLVTAAILYLALIPGPPTNGLGWDKANHTIAMAVVTVISIHATRSVRWAVVLGGAYALLLGLLIEVAQGLLTVHRRAEWADVAADAVGAVTVMLLITGWRLRKRKAVTA